MNSILNNNSKTLIDLPAYFLYMHISSFSFCHSLCYWYHQFINILPAKGVHDQNDTPTCLTKIAQETLPGWHKWHSLLVWIDLPQSLIQTTATT
jgi:hypothetical protein